MKALEEALHDRIAKRAFQFFEQDGRVDGLDLAHWFKVEADVLSLKPEIQESKDSVMVVAHIPSMEPQDVEICVGEHEAIIRTSMERQTKASDLKERVGAEKEDLFLLAQWPWDVDPATANASLKDTVLTVVAKKSPSARSAIG